MLVDQIKVMALEHVQREAGAGLLLPVEQLLDADAVLLAAKYMDRHAERLAPAIHKAAAEQKIGAQDRQHQLHELLVGDDVFAGAF